MSQSDKNNNFFNKLTIVGGQPPRKNLPDANGNIEKILFKAATDESFKYKLLIDRKSILEDPELSLSSQDKILLESIPDNRLRDMIEKFIIQRTSRRNFLKNAAATLALLATGCNVAATESSTDEVPPPLVTHKPVPEPDYSMTMGIRPEHTPIPTYIPVDVGTDGAIVIHPYSNLKLIIPRGALDKTLEIIIGVIPDGLEYKHGFYSGEEFNNKNNFSYIMPHEFSPQDLQFKKEISICYPISELEYKKLSGLHLTGKITWREFTEKSREKLSVETSKDGYAIIKSKKFGIYTLGYLLEPEKPVFPEMTLISHGKIKMDVNYKRTDVEINSFYMGKTQITNKEYSRYDPNHLNPGNDLPAVNLSWYDAVKYCNWLTMNSPDLSLKDCCYSGVPPDITCDISKKGYRIPTEAEWKYMFSKKESDKLDLIDTGDRVFQLGNGDNKAFFWCYSISHGMYGHLSPEDKNDYTGLRIVKTA